MISRSFALAALPLAVFALGAASPSGTAGSLSSPSGLTDRGFVAIPAGPFYMGSPGTEADRGDDEGPRHKVFVSAFYMGKHEVTQKEWFEVMGSNPSFYKGDPLPVETVSWHAVFVYCNKKSIMDGLTPCYSVRGRTDPETWAWNADVRCDYSANGYRLPTEAEWEYACRAGTGTAYSTGAVITEDQANFGVSIGRTTPVGTYPANAWGLHDMHGNVWEMCQDWYGDGYYAKSPERNPIGPYVGEHRVIRGGSWLNDAEFLRSSERLFFNPERGNDAVGFRIVRRP